MWNKCMAWQHCDYAQYHSMYSAGQLSQRGFVHLCRHLFTRSPDEVALERRSLSIERMSRKAPRKTSGRHAFFSWLFGEAKAQLPDGARMSPELRQDIMRVHGHLHAMLGPEEQAMFAERALAEAASRAATLEEDRQHAQDAWELQRQRLAAEREQAGFTSRSVAVRLTVQDLAAIGAKLKSSAWTQCEMQKLRRSAQAPPVAPSAEALAAFASCSAPVPGPPCRAPPAWLRAICRQRSELRGAIVQRWAPRLP